MKRKLLFVIALLIVAVAASACGNGDTGTVTGVGDDGYGAGGPPAVDEIIEKEEEEEEVDILTLVPEQDLGGFEIRFLTDIIWDWDFGPLHMMHVEEMTGEVVNDAIFRRNAIVESRLNVTISEVVSMNNDAKGMIGRLVRAGDDEFDVVLGESWNIGSQLAQTGLLVNLRDVPGLQLDAPWWD